MNRNNTLSSTHPDAPVAIFVEDLGGGGAEKISVTLANGLAARGIAVDMLLWRASGPQATWSAT